MNTMGYRACIFDLDGTLANTLNSIAYFGNGTLAEFNLPPIPTDDYKQLVGNGADVLMKRMLDKVGARLSESEFKKFRAEYDRRYESEPMKLVTPYDGLPQLLTELKAEGFLLGVLSNKPDNMTKFIADKLYGDVITTACGQKDGVPKKPDPTALLNMMNELGVAPSDVLYIGDSGVDMQTGTAAGANTCGVLWGFRDEAELLQNGAVHLAKNADELGRIARSKM